MSGLFVVKTHDLIWGTNGDNDIDGRDWGEYIDGESGNDTIHALGGIDTVEGGFGDDTIFGGDGGDFLYGGYDYSPVDGDAVVVVQLTGGASGGDDNVHSPTDY